MSTENTLAAIAERDMAKDAEIERLRAELEQFKPQPMSQNCRSGRHTGTGDDRCYNCRCLCHATDTRWQGLKDYLAANARAVTDEAAEYGPSSMIGARLCGQAQVFALVRQHMSEIEAAP